MTNKLIDEIRNNLDNGSVTSEMLFEEATSRAREYQDEYNSFITIMDKKEDDLKNGKDVRMEDYVVNTTKNYTSRLTTSTNKISTSVNSFLKKGIEGVFKVASRLVED